MAEVLRSPSHFPSSPLSCDANDGSHGLLSTSNGDRGDRAQTERRRKSGGGAVQRKREARRREVKAEEQLSLLALLLTVFRKSLLGCKTEAAAVEEFRSMEIGWPTDVQHVAHVTFDPFHGFLGLPVEFEPEVHRRAPSASANVFGVSTESMQCSFDSRGNSVPTILLLMQRRLYELGGIGEEGIFRINAENSQEELVRDQLNNGIVPESVDVHCLAGLIKAWFRELPTGLLDSLSFEQMMQCETEEDCSRLCRLLPPTEAALLAWAINLMADVAQEEQRNKMNARNVATVFAPNMTQMADPLTALMYAVQVMNFLRMLILKTLKERQESTSPGAYVANDGPSDEDGHWSPPLSLYTHCKEATKPVHVIKEPVLDSELSAKEEEADSLQNSEVTACHSTNAIFSDYSASGDGSSSGHESAVKSSNAVHVNSRSKNTMQSYNRNNQKGRKAKSRSIDLASLPAEKSRRASIASLMNSQVELAEAWR